MAKSLKTEKSKEGGGIDPALWESAPAQAVGAVSNASLASMTGGDAGTFEGIVDYILMGEERDAPGEQEIVASEQAGLLVRNYPEEVCTTATLEPSAKLPGGPGLETSQPSFTPAGGDLDGGSFAGGDMGFATLDEGTEKTTGAPTVSGKLGFGTASVPGGGGGTDGGQVVAHKGDDAKVFKAIGGPDPGQLAAQNAAAVSGMGGMVEGLGAQVDSSVSGALGKLEGSYSSNVSALDGALGTNMGLIQGAFSSARASVSASALDAKSRVQRKSEEAVGTIDVSSKALLREGNATIANAGATVISQANTTMSTAMGEITSAQGQTRAIAAKWSKAAEDKGKALADAYRGRGNGGTEGKRDEVRAQVAEGYGAGYSEDLPNVGANAVELLENEKANVRSAIRELIRPLVAVELPNLQENLRLEVSNAAEEARTGVEKGRDEAFSGIDEHHTRAGEELSSSESAARTDLLEVHGSASASLDGVHMAGEESVQAMGEGLRSHLLEKSEQFRSLIANNPMLPLAELQNEIGSLSAELIREAGASNLAIQQVATELATDETQITTEAVSSMGQIGTAAAAGAAGLASQSEIDLDSLAGGFESSVDELISGYEGNLATLKQQVQEGVGAVLATALGGLSTTLDGVRTGVGDFVTGFDGDLDKAVNTEMVNAIDGKAEEEAAKIKEPSFWDKVCTVLAVVLVVVAIVAITVITGGLGAAFVGGAFMASLGPIGVAALTIVAGAVVGVVSSGLSEIVVQIATKGFDPRNWDWKKIGVETLVGGIVGGLTAGLGVGIKELGKWGMRVKDGITVVKSPALQRIAMGSTRLIDSAGDLSTVGRIAESTGGSLIKDGATWAATGERPTLLDVGKNIVLKVGSTEYAQGMTDLVMSEGTAGVKKGFSAYMEFISEEAATGAKTEDILERVEAPVAELGDKLELTTDYKPTWSPTW